MPWIQEVLREHFENTLDEANLVHEKKMIIEGHFAGTRAKYYTDRDKEQLRDVYQKAYPFIDLNIDEAAQLKVEARASSPGLEDLEIHLARQSVLEAKLTLLEDELDRMKSSLRILEKRSQG